MSDDLGSDAAPGIDRLYDELNNFKGRLSQQRRITYGAYEEQLRSLQKGNDSLKAANEEMVSQVEEHKRAEATAVEALNEARRRIDELQARCAALEARSKFAADVLLSTNEAPANVRPKRQELVKGLESSSTFRATSPVTALTHQSRVPTPARSDAPENDHDTYVKTPAHLHVAVGGHLEDPETEDLYTASVKGKKRRSSKSPSYVHDEHTDVPVPKSTTKRRRTQLLGSPKINGAFSSSEGILSPSTKFETSDDVDTIAVAPRDALSRANETDVFKPAGKGMVHTMSGTTVGAASYSDGTVDQAPSMIPEQPEFTGEYDETSDVDSPARLEVLSQFQPRTLKVKNVLTIHTAGGLHSSSQPAQAIAAAATNNGESHSTVPPASAPATTTATIHAGNNVVAPATIQNSIGPASTIPTGPRRTARVRKETELAPGSLKFSQVDWRGKAPKRTV